MSVLANGEEVRACAPCMDGCEACSSAFTCAEGKCAAETHDQIGEMCLPKARCLPSESLDAQGVCRPCAPLALSFSASGLALTGAGFDGATPATGSFAAETPRFRTVPRGDVLGPHLASVPPPTRDGGVFAGWWFRMDGFGPVTPLDQWPPCGEPFPLQQVTLVPLWVPAIDGDPNTRVVVFRSGSGEECPPLALPAAQPDLTGALGCAPEAREAGATFRGWFDKPQQLTGATKVSEASPLGSGLTYLYGHWEYSGAGAASCSQVTTDQTCYASSGCFWSGDTCKTCESNLPGCIACARDGSKCLKCKAGQVLKPDGRCTARSPCEALEQPACSADPACQWESSMRYCTARCYGVTWQADTCSAIAGCFWTAGGVCKTCGGSAGKGCAVCVEGSCLVCRDGWSRQDNGTCIPACDAAAGMGWVDGACVACSDVNRFADRYSGRCVSHCPDGTTSVSLTGTPDTNTCELCPSGCVACTSFTNVNGEALSFGCSACPSGSRLTGLGTEGVESGTSCTTCYGSVSVSRSTCEATESGASPTGQACGGNWTVNDAQQPETSGYWCPLGYYGDSGGCHACHPSCTSGRCTGAGDNECL